MRGYSSGKISDYTKEQCEEYLAKYPNGLNADYIRERLSILNHEFRQKISKDDECWNTNHNSLKQLQKYERLYPKGKHIDECKIRQKELSEKIALICYSLQYRKKKKRRQSQSKPNRQKQTKTVNTKHNIETTRTSYSHKIDSDEIIKKILLTASVIGLLAWGWLKMGLAFNSITTMIGFVTIRNIWKE